jgi:hypothetical protein
MPLIKEIKQSIAETEEEKGLITLYIVWNDYGPFQDKEKIRWLFDVQRLCGLIAIIFSCILILLVSIQLPKMPREYVTRLVFDQSHRNLVIYKKVVLF